VGIRSALRLVQAAQEQAMPLRAPTAIRSPWSSGDLSRIVWADVLGTDVAAWPLTRAAAVEVPAVARARHLLVGTIARLPLRAVRLDQPVDPQPLWLTRTDGSMSPWHRLAWTVDDCLFSGWSLWGCERDARGGIQRVERVPAELWTWGAGEQAGTVLIDGEEVDQDTVLLIPGPHEGILTSARSTILGARMQELMWQRRVAAPIPAMEIHQTTEDPLTEDEQDKLIDAWVAARTDPDGAVAYTPSNIELRPHGTATTDLLIEARNAVAVDIASHTGLPAQALNASLSTSSLTYSTAETAQGEVNVAAALYASPIAARLSMDDVVPRGQRCAFDLTFLTAQPPAPYGPTTED
jgi:Phage portal protein